MLADFTCPLTGFTAETSFCARALYGRITLCNDSLFRDVENMHNLIIPSLK